MRGVSNGWITSQNCDRWMSHDHGTSHVCRHPATAMSIRETMKTTATDFGRFLIPLSKTNDNDVIVKLATWIASQSGAIQILSQANIQRFGFAQHQATQAQLFLSSSSFFLSFLVAKTQLEINHCRDLSRWWAPDWSRKTRPKKRSQVYLGKKQFLFYYFDYLIWFMFILVLQDTDAK